MHVIDSLVTGLTLALPVQTPWPHLIYLLLLVVPAGRQSAKFRKYSSLTPSFHFSPVCVETLGAWGSCARSLVRRIGSRVMEQSGDNRATQVLIQKVAIEVQRGNAASVMATIPSSEDWAEFASLPTV